MKKAPRPRRKREGNYDEEGRQADNRALSTGAAPILRIITC